MGWKVADYPNLDAAAHASTRADQCPDHSRSFGHFEHSDCEMSSRPADPLKCKQPYKGRQRRVIVPPPYQQAGR